MSEEKKVPTIQDLINLPVPGSAQISPDGEWVAYTVTKPDWKENEFLAQVWLVSASGGAPRQLTFARSSSQSPRWSPDGHWLAFLSKRESDDFTQVYRLSPFGGEAERLTEHDADISAFEWAPDGSALAFLASDAKGEEEKRREEQYGEYQIEDEDHVRSHLWLLRLEDKKTLKLTHGKQFHVVGFGWNPRGGQIAFETWPSPDWGDFDRGSIYLLDLDMLGVSLLSEEGCSSPFWSPDGERLAYLHLGTPTYYANNTIRVIRFSGQPTEHEILAGSEMSAGPNTANVLEASAFKGPAPFHYQVPMDFDEEISLDAWSLDGLHGAALQGTEAHLFRIHPETGQVTRLTPSGVPGWFSLFATYSKDSSRAALVAYDQDHYAEIVLLETASGAYQRLTDFTALLQGWKLGQSEVVRWKSPDGTEIEGILTKPVDFDPQQKYPLLVAIHGGPSWVSLLGKLANAYERRFYPIHEWVARGALVLQPNYRGSAGYGEAFRALNVRNLGLGDCADVVSGVDALIEKGWVDPQRVGVMGWSQGGYISAFCTTYASDRFRAASVGAGISNWVTYYVNTDIHPFTRQYLGATPWEDAEVYQSTSPMTYIRKAHTPTLIQHGQNDRRVPAPNAYELYQGLRDMQVEARLVTYPGMPHGPTSPRVCRQIMQENLSWFNRWIWDEPVIEDGQPACYVALGSLMPGDGMLELPAYIREVMRHARRDRAEFCLFTPGSGLVRASGSSATDPALAQEPALEPQAIAERARQVAEQLRADNIQRLVIFTLPDLQDAATLTGIGCLHLAAGLAGGVKIEQRTV